MAKKQTSVAKTEAGLNLRQEQFCQMYINADREMFGNGTQCYLEVYGSESEDGKKISYLAAMAAASRLLRNVKVIERINSLLETGGFSDENVDKQHLFLINQHADLKTKMAAIKEYNALKKRVDSKLEGAQFNQINFYNLNASEIEREISTTLAEIKAITKSENIPASENG